MANVFIGARVRINCERRVSHKHFGVVLNTIQFNKAIVEVDELGKMPYDFDNLECVFDFDNLECVFDKFDRVQAFGPNCEDHGRGQVLRQIPADAGTYVGWFEVQLDRDPVGSTRNYRYDDLRFIEACPHVENFRIGDHVEVLPSDKAYAGRRGVVRAFRAGQVEVDFGNEKGTYAFAEDLKNLHTKSSETIFRVDTIQAEKRAILGSQYGASKKTLEETLKEAAPVLNRCYTVSATIVLASGREVRIPDPNPEKWELFKVCTLGPYHQVHAHDSKNYGPGLRIRSAPELGGQGKDIAPSVLHEEGRCWLKDMTRIVNMTEKVDHFTTKYAYVTELRIYREHIIEAELDSDRPYPTLRAYLW